jgi:3-carboxy-cis,cis-muconate cycloisomerase
MEHEHERAAGAWHAEWGPLRELLRSTGSAAAWLRDCLEHLVVDPERMRANLGDAMLAERVAGAIGGADAGDRVREALAGGASLADVAREHLSAEEAERLLDPATYLGATDQLIDRALSAHAHRS